MLEKKSVIDRIEITEINTIEIRRADKIFENGKEISKGYHRHVLCPGDSLDGQDEKVVTVANSIWTPEVISEYQKFISSKKHE